MINKILVNYDIIKGLLFLILAISGNFIAEIIDRKYLCKTYCNNINIIFYNRYYTG